jgi:hypothetical protein
MSRGVQVVKQGDVRRAAKGALDAGLALERIEINHAGTIVIIIGKPGAADSENLLTSTDTAMLVSADEGWNDAP